MARNTKIALLLSFVLLSFEVSAGVAIEIVVDPDSNYATATPYFTRHDDHETVLTMIRDGWDGAYRRRHSLTGCREPGWWAIAEAKYEDARFVGVACGADSKARVKAVVVDHCESLFSGIECEVKFAKYDDGKTSVLDYAKDSDSNTVQPSWLYPDVWRKDPPGLDDGPEIENPRRKTVNVSGAPKTITYPGPRLEKTTKP